MAFSLIAYAFYEYVNETKKLFRLPLSGAKVEVYDSFSNKLGEGTTGSNGVATISGLETPSDNIAKVVYSKDQYALGEFYVSVADNQTIYTAREMPPASIVPTVEVKVRLLTLAGGVKPAVGQEVIMRVLGDNVLRSDSNSYKWLIPSEEVVEYTNSEGVAIFYVPYNTVISLAFSGKVRYIKTGTSNIEVNEELD